MNLCEGHNCPLCKAVFSHELIDGQCFQAIGTMKWKTCKACTDELEGKGAQGKLAFGGVA